MKLLEKQVTLGKYQFKVATDRDLAIKSFEAYPDVIEYILKNESNATDDVELIVSAIKKKELALLFEYEEKLAQLVRFVLPLMLEKAGEEVNAQEIIEYATKNDVVDDFNAGIIELLMLGFMQRGLGQPKIKFSMN